MTLPRHRTRRRGSGRTEQEGGDVTYRIWLRFRCDDHRLIGEAEHRVDSTVLWHSTLGDLIDMMKPVVLDQYPYISDSIDYITVEELRLQRD